MLDMETNRTIAATAATMKAQAFMMVSMMIMRG